MDNKQPVWADNFIKALSKSKIALNLSQGNGSKYYTSDRFAQLIGNGLLVMIDQKTKFSDFFNKDEIELHPCGKDHLKRRKDDNHDTVMLRYDTYMEKTKPILDFYSSKDSFTEIDGSMKIDEITSKITDIIDV